MGWPQYAYLALGLIGLGVEFAKHGEAKTGRHNAIHTTIAWALILWVLKSGGFFG